MAVSAKKGGAAISRDTEDFLAKYLKELKQNNAAVFVGAGLSKAAGYVDWQGLLAPVADALGLDLGKETDLVSLAQYHLNARAFHVLTEAYPAFAKLFAHS